MTLTDPPQLVDLPTATGPMRTEVIAPAATKDGRKFPGVVLWSEIFQITAPVRRTAMQLAAQGYVVAIPEVYHELMSGPGVVLAYDAAGADTGNACKINKELASYDADAKACVEFLQNDSRCTGSVGTMGMCLGGHLAFRCAMQPAVKAAACLYATDIHKRSLGKGMNDNSLDRIKEIKGELLMIWGRQDPHVPREGRRIIYEALADADANFNWLEFNGQHAFIRDEGPRYDAALARTCYGVAFDLFGRTLHA